MRCVTSISYSVVINGEAGFPFQPSRGLRKSDPLSPYLFIICAEVFSYLIDHAHANGYIHGVKVSRRSPSISHLFFADDRVIFSRTSQNEVEKVLQCIQAYEQASGSK